VRKLPCIQAQKSSRGSGDAIVHPAPAAVGLDRRRRPRGADPQRDVIAERERVEDLLVGGAQRLRHCEHGRNDAGAGMASRAAMTVIDIERARRSRIRHRRTGDGER
jgi:hypothetical protein